MEKLYSIHRPLLRTRGFSTLHIHIFEQILIGRTNREISSLLGYSRKSHAVIDHSRAVMYKILSCESLCKKDHMDKVIYPRKHFVWWAQLFRKHKDELLIKAIEPKYYSDEIFSRTKESVIGYSTLLLR